MNTSSVPTAATVSHINKSVEPRDNPELKIHADRRRHRRTDLHEKGYIVERWDGMKLQARPFGVLQNLSAGGLCVRADQCDVRVGTQVRIRLKLKSYAGIFPFVANDGSGRGTDEWVGWMTVVRVSRLPEGDYEIAGRLVDMREIDRGMLGLYLSAQPLAA